MTSAPPSAPPTPDMVDRWQPLQGVPPAGSSPLYLQLAQSLAQDIQAGRYPVQQALPSERWLAQAMGVSRITARKAIDVLVARGWVLRRHGAGNFIAPRLAQPLARLSSFTTELQQRGYVPGVQWLLRERTVATPTEAAALSLPQEDPQTPCEVARLHRVRLADGVPMALEYSVLPASVLPDPLALDGSLYAWLAQVGRAPVRARQHVCAVNAPPDVAVALGIAPGVALLQVRRTAFDAAGATVEITQSLCRSDYYDFHVELQHEST